MKNLKDYIIESVDFEIIKNNYKNYCVVTLVRREVDCKSISKEDFVKFIKEDLQKAVNEYTEIVKPYNEARIKSHIDIEVKHAIVFAEKKWKTQKKRDEYIANVKKNAENQKLYLEDPKKIFFDFQPNKGDMGINYDCILRVNDSDEKLAKCYDEVKSSKYFNKATGWAFKYESSSKDKPSTYSFRPYVDLLLDESTRAEQKRDEEMLNKAIEDFYKNSNYWGD